MEIAEGQQTVSGAGKGELTSVRGLLTYFVASLQLLFSISVFAQSSSITSVVVSDAGTLQHLFLMPVDSLTVTLMPGEYHLIPAPITDSTCGNCENPKTPVDATVGLHIRGRYVRISGPGDRSAVIHTHAGYGIFFDGCMNALIENMTITGGERDTSGNATDAAIVVKNGTVAIRNNLIMENIGDSATVAKTIGGVMGICGREDAVLTIVDNDIIRNSWDGIALYRGAASTIERNVIDGIDKARGTQIGGGRGVGIGVTWDARATIRQNLVTRYWKGIGLFVDANGTVENNIIEDIITWGIAFWDADKGRPIGRIERNVVYKTGACGASITRSQQGDTTGWFVGNIIVETAQNPKYDSPEYYCFQCALALQAVPEGFRIERNLFFNNRRATTDLPDYDVPREQFMQAIARQCESLSPSFAFLATRKRGAGARQSLFLRDFCSSKTGSGN